MGEISSIYISRMETSSINLVCWGIFCGGASIACSAGVQLKAKPNFDTLHPEGALEIRNVDKVTG